MPLTYKILLDQSQIMNELIRFLFICILFIVQVQFELVMGNTDNSSKLNPGILEYIEQQYARVLKNKAKKHLTLSQVLQIHPHEDYPFDFRHLGILFVCDKQLDGLFSFQNFEHFALWIQFNLVSVQMYEFKSQLQARTVAKIIQTLDKKEGQAMIINWFMRMLIADKQTKIIKSYTYIQIQAIKLIYEILGVKVMSDLDIQSFFYLIKKSSEEMGFRIEEMKENEWDDDYEQYIEVKVCKQFITHFLKGAQKILREIGYNNTLI